MPNNTCHSGGVIEDLLGRDAASRGRSEAQFLHSERLSENEGRVAEALAQVLGFLHGSEAGADLGEAGLQFLSADESYDPLSYAEAIALGFGLTQRKIGRCFSHADLLEYTFNHFKEPFASSVIYRTITKLSERGLISKEGAFPNSRTGRLAEFFSVNENGVVAFWLALLNHQRLRTIRRDAA